MRIPLEWQGEYKFQNRNSIEINISTFKKNNIIQHMNFLDFVKKNSKQNDPDLLSFISAIRKIESIPPSSDPRILGRFLYRKLNHQQTRGFQKWFTIYKSMEKQNELPHELLDEKIFLAAINTIATMQKSDPEYADF